MVNTVAGEYPDRAPRVAAPVEIRYQSILDFHEHQAFNISRTGMFLPTPDPFPAGTLIEFSFALTDGLSLFAGKGEVVRVMGAPQNGMGIRFVDLDETSQRFLDAIVKANEREHRQPAVVLDFGNPAAAPGSPAPSPVRTSSLGPLKGATHVQPGLFVSGSDLHMQLTPATVGYFTNNPLINIRLGGFVIPCDEEVSLGSLFNVVIEDAMAGSLFVGRGKVVAKHEHRVGVRLMDPEKAVMARLQAEVGRIAPKAR
jgi:uncharacterized protein (TIGR02266 family)